MRYRTFTPLLLVTLASQAFGQATEPARPTSTLEETLVTATRTEEDVFDVPYTAHVIGREDFLDRRAARTLPEALSETPGVMIQKTSYGQASPFIRGFTGFRTLMLIDGIRLNNAVFREGPNQYWSTVDLLTVDQLDVVKGPSSVLYGSDAIGGTVNAITRLPQMLDWPEPADGKKAVAPPAQGWLFHPGAFYRYASAENSHTARGEFSLGVTPHFGIIGGVTYKNFDDLRGGDVIGLQSGSGYAEIDGDVKLLFRPTKNIDITAAFQRVEQNNAPRTHATIFGKSFSGTALGTDLQRDFDQLRELAYLQAEVRDPAEWLSKVRFSFSFHRQGEEQDRIRANERREITGFVDDQYGVLLNLESPSPIGTLTYGVEYYHDEVESYGDEFRPGGVHRVLPRGPVADDASYDLLGVYLQDQFKLGERVEVTAGVRYSHVGAHADVVDPNPADAMRLGPIDKTWDAFTASLRARVDVTKSWNFFGGVSQGFRAPNLSDLTAFDIARSGERETPAPDLDEEKFLSFEIATKARIEKLHADVYAAFFHTMIDDQIVRYPTGRTIDGEREVTRANTGDGYIQGVELGLNWNVWRGISVFGNFTWAEGEVDTFGANGLRPEPVTRIQPITGLVGLRWQSEDARFWLEGTALFARHQDRLSSGDMLDTQRIPPGGTPGYEVYTVRGGWRVRENMTLTLAVENVSNEDYRIHGSGLNEAGTNVVLSSHVVF